MNRIFIEAKNNKTSEFHFLKAVLNRFFPDKEVGFIFMDGIDNLFNEAIRNQMALARESGEQVLVFADADTEAKGWGCQKRKAAIEKGSSDHDVSFPYFLYPDNQSDGDVETLMECAARRDLHRVFFDCFEDYEKCVSGVTDDKGEALYSVPNLKGKLHTYINSQRLSNTQRKRLGHGDWLFEENMYWNLDIDALQPMKKFLEDNLV